LTFFLHFDFCFSCFPYVHIKNGGKNEQIFFIILCLVWLGRWINKKKLQIQSVSCILETTLKNQRKSFLIGSLKKTFREEPFFFVVPFFLQNLLIFLFSLEEKIFNSQRV